MEELSHILEPYSLALVAAAGFLLILLILRLRSWLKGSGTPEEVHDVDWEERARAAEARAAKAEDILKSEMAPHLVESMKAELVQKLVTHRRDLLETQHEATQQTEDLEKRLAAIQSKLESRQEQLEASAGIIPALPAPAPASTLPDGESTTVPEPREPARRNPFVKSTQRRVPEARLSFTEIVARRAKLKGGPEGPPESPPQAD